MEMKALALSKKEAIERSKEKFKEKPEIVHIIKQNICPKTVDLKFLVNIDTIYEKFDNIPYFDESLRFEKETAYHIVGALSH